jgi:hypothetical protein
MGVTAMDMVARTIAGDPPEEKIVDLGFHLCPRASTRPVDPEGKKAPVTARKAGGKSPTKTGAAAK